MLRYKMILTILALILLAPILYLFFMSSYERYQNGQHQKLIVHNSNGHSTKNAVIFFSRSGATGLMANRIAANIGADEYKLSAPDYELSTMGLARATIDARNHEAKINPEKIDLSKYETIYLGSPIWLYSPAPPIWAFLKNNRFDGKKVVLFNSHNSKFDQRFIDEFKAIAIANGATSFEHKVILRGRVDSQMTADEFLTEVDKLFPKK